MPSVRVELMFEFEAGLACAATAVIAMFFVPMVTAGGLGTTATSCAPPVARYSLATWSAISLLTFAVVPGAGCQLDQLDPPPAAKTTNAAVDAIRSTASVP